jgi:hypothetical protein
MTTATEARLPKQVQAAAARARQILEEKKAQREKITPPNGVELIEHTEVPIPSLNREPAAGAQPAQPPPAAADDGRDLAYWKHRAKTLDGALKSAKDKHAAIVSDLQTQIIALKEQLRESQEKLAAAAPIKVEDYFSPEEVEAMGEGEARIIASKLAATTRDAVKAARAELQVAATPPPAAPAAAAVPIYAATEDTAEPTPEDEFWNELDVLMPNWEQINKDKRWLAFCGTTYRDTGMTVQELLDAAQARLNARAAANLFRAFEASLNVIPTPPPPTAPAARNAGGRENGGALPPAAADGRPSQAEIAEHFKNRSLYFNKPAHPKHITEEQDKAFLARLKSA